jgi:hypothetical protein
MTLLTIYMLLHVFVIEILNKHIDEHSFEFLKVLISIKIYNFLFVKQRTTRCTEQKKENYSNASN